MNLKLRLPSLLIAVLLAGCTGVRHESERAVRRDQQTVTEVYRPTNQRPALPDLSTNSGLGDFLRYAMLNQPKVEAAYYEWSASVERITTARSLPDPRLTFEMYIADTITSLMPGFGVAGAGQTQNACGRRFRRERLEIFHFRNCSAAIRIRGKEGLLPTAFPPRKNSCQSAKSFPARRLGTARSLPERRGQSHVAGRVARADRAGPVDDGNRQSRRLAKFAHGAVEGGVGTAGRSNESANTCQI